MTIFEHSEVKTLETAALLYHLQYKTLFSICVNYHIEAASITETPLW